MHEISQKSRNKLRRKISRLIFHVIITMHHVDVDAFNLPFQRISSGFYELVRSDKDEDISAMLRTHVFLSRFIPRMTRSNLIFWEKKVRGEGRLIESHGSRCSFNLGRRNVAMMREKLLTIRNVFTRSIDVHARWTFAPNSRTSRSIQ